MLTATLPLCTLPVAFDVCWLALLLLLPTTPVVLSFAPPPLCALLVGELGLLLLLLLVCAPLFGLVTCAQRPGLNRCVLPALLLLFTPHAAAPPATESCMAVRGLKPAAQMS